MQIASIAPQISPAQVICEYKEDIEGPLVRWILIHKRVVTTTRHGEKETEQKAHQGISLHGQCSLS
jgi:hypothetical protein